MEAGSSASAVAQRVVGGDERGSPESEKAGLGPESDYAGEDWRTRPLGRRGE
jgi:hypothetical protein